MRRLVTKIITYHALLKQTRTKNFGTSVREEFKICHPFEIQSISLEKVENE